MPVLLPWELFAFPESTFCPTKMSIHVIIIGAGLAGLSAAISIKLANSEHRVTVLESVEELAELGVSGISPFSTGTDTDLFHSCRLDYN